MQQLTSAAEVCSLLDHALDTIHQLNQALAQYVWPPAPAPQLEPPPSVEAVPITEPTVAHQRIAPVLTIKLSDLNREIQLDAQERQQAHTLRRQNRPRPKQKTRLNQRLSQMREVEVIYRKGFKHAS